MYRQPIAAMLVPTRKMTRPPISGGSSGPDAFQDRRQQGLDDAREHGHAEDQREAAEFQGGNRGLEKNRVMARRTQKSAADPTSRQRL
jgi:hypothetical protein